MVVNSTNVAIKEDHHLNIANNNPPLMFLFIYPVSWLVVNHINWVVLRRLW